MDKVWYLVIAIAIIALLAGVAVTTYIINKRMPAPKGCEHIKIDESTCEACESGASCPIKESLKEKEGKDNG